MDKLSLVDQMMYKLDQYQVASLVMGGVSILTPAAKSSPLNAQKIADHLAARLEKIPLLRQKLVQDPLRIGSVRKISDPQFNINDHIFIEKVARPGGYRQLTAALARLSAAPLELDQLWRWTIIDGLQDGKLAVACKIHHALADGVGIGEVLGSMYDLQPVKPEKPDGASTETPDAPNQYALLGSALGETMGRLLIHTPKLIAKSAAPVASTLSTALRDSIANRGEPKPEDPLLDMHATSLNTEEFSGERAIAYKTLSLAEVKSLARRFECKVNDIAMLLYSCAMEHYFENTGEDIDFDLQCIMPINTRSDEQSAQAGNQLMGARMSLHNTIADPVERLQAICIDTREAKEAMQPGQSAVSLQEVGDALLPPAVDALLYLANRYDLLAKLLTKAPYLNAVLSNVPGPPVPMYVANGLMEESIPLIPMLDVLAVSGGVVSLADNLTFGFHCDGGVVRQPELFVEGVETGMEKLRKAAKQKLPKQKPAKRRK